MNDQLVGTGPAKLSGSLSHCAGTFAEKVLARRQLDAGGRLLHVVTDQAEQQVVVKAFGQLDGCFFWQPPKRKPTAFAKSLSRAFRTHWSTTGPDSFRSRPEEKLEIFKTGGSKHHMCLLDAERCIEAEMSGEVILNPDMQIAQEFDVQMLNPDLKACGTFSWRWMILFVLLELVWHTGGRLFLSTLSSTLKPGTFHGGSSWWGSTARFLLPWV